MGKHGPIVLCGLGRMGWRVLAYLQAAGLRVVVVDTNCRTDDPRLKGVRVVTGDCRQREVLEAAGINQAGGALILVSDDLVNVASALMVRSLNADVRIVLRMFNQNLLGRLGKAVHNVFALSTSMLTAPILAMTALTGQALGAFRLDGKDNGARQVVEISVSSASPLRGITLDKIAGPTVQLLAHFSADGKGRYLNDVVTSAALQVGDRLIVCGEPGAVSQLLNQSGTADDADPLWAGWARRLLRVIGQTLADIERPVRICTAILLAVITTSTLIFHLGVAKFSFADALFRTISIMATGADMHEGDFIPGWMKIYVAFLRVAGAALTATFTAIVTNYLLRARLGGALEARRIPDGGHIIVCGLGPVGFRVVEELVALHKAVVVIELSPDNRFVSAVRHLGVPVILGDAAVAEIFRQAHAATARAVIAATNNDLVNLEIALLVREMKADQRVVLLQSDPQLAQMLREGANVRLAVSVPALAAPAFLAGLFGDRVLSVILVGDRLLAVLDLVVQERDVLMKGKTASTAAREFGFVPTMIMKGNGGDREPNEPLEAGDRLVAIVALGEVEKLLRRQPGESAE